MSVIAELLKEFPAAGKYRAELEAMCGEVERLEAENAKLKEELARFIDRWETLDGEALNVLLYLSRNERGDAAEIARVNRVNIQIVEAYLKQLVAGQYVQAHVNGEGACYALAQKGQWYLRERGLLPRRNVTVRPAAAVRAAAERSGTRRKGCDWRLL